MIKKKKYRVYLIADGVTSGFIYLTDVNYYYNKYKEAELDFLEAKRQYEYTQKHSLYKKEN